MFSNPPVVKSPVSPGPPELKSTGPFDPKSLGPLETVPPAKFSPPIVADSGSSIKPPGGGG